MQVWNVCVLSLLFLLMEVVRERERIGWAWRNQIPNKCCIRREFNIQVKCKRALDYPSVWGFDWWSEKERKRERKRVSISLRFSFFFSEPCWLTHNKWPKLYILCRARANQSKKANIYSRQPSKKKIIRPLSLCVPLAAFHQIYITHKDPTPTKLLAHCFVGRVMCTTFLCLFFLLVRGLPSYKLPEPPFAERKLFNGIIPLVSFTHCLMVD